MTTTTTTKTAPKLYPFNMNKHGHDLEFQKNRAYIEQHEMEDGDREWDDARFDALENLQNALREALSYMPRDPRGIVYMPGKVWAVANAAKIWANAQRGDGTRYSALANIV